MHNLWLIIFLIFIISAINFQMIGPLYFDRFFNKVFFSWHIAKQKQDENKFKECFEHLNKYLALDLHS
jgi:hypothetical protein